MRDLFSLTLQHDRDVVTARQRAAEIAAQLGFDPLEQTKVATAVSEVARNAFRYAQGGSVTFAIDPDSRPQRFVVTIADRGSGIPRLHAVLTRRTPSSAGIGIAGARRLVDGFAIDSSREGTRVELAQLLPANAEPITGRRATEIADCLSRREPQGIAEEMQQQNEALLRALEELQRRQQELARLNLELEDTNRGVVALYAELDEKADHLRRADELKSRFLSNMTHEFRTPVNSIIGLTNLLIEEREQAGQRPAPEIVHIRNAAEQLSELVNDLLDLAKVEAGKTVVRPGEFRVENLFGALRGMLRPLLVNPAVSLTFDHADDLPALSTDEGKVSQILRNLISNALKFTEAGGVRVSAQIDGPGRMITFTVADTGIGIAPEDQIRIFEEFTQIEHRLQIGVRGTGLGLPLSKRLAELLGGAVSVTSRPGHGSTFTVTLPVRYAAPRYRAAPAEPPRASLDTDAPADSGMRTVEPDHPIRVLTIDDEEVARFVIRQCLSDSAFDVADAAGGEEGLRRARALRPDVILLDLVMPDLPGRTVLERLRNTAATHDIPVIVVSSSVLDPAERHVLLRHATAVLSKADLSRETLGEAVRSAAGREPVRRAPM
jgi:signal transduction histidine kinase